MAARVGRRMGRGITRRLVMLERGLVQTLMVPFVVFADRRIAKHLKRTA